MAVTMIMAVCMASRRVDSARKVMFVLMPRLRGLIVTVRVFAHGRKGGWINKQMPCPNRNRTCQ